MNKLRAMTYLFAKGPGAKVRDNYGNVWILKSNGDVEAARCVAAALPQNGTYSIIEPEKTNEELAGDLEKMWNKLRNREDTRNCFKFIFDVMDRKNKMDQKIKESK